MMLTTRVNVPKRGETDQQTEETVPEAVGTLRCIDTCREQNIKQCVVGLEHGRVTKRVLVSREVRIGTASYGGGSGQCHMGADQDVSHGGRS